MEYSLPARVGEQASSVGVVGVDDLHARRGLEEPALGGEVRLHGRMEVQVVLGEVREDRDVPVDRVGAPELEGVAGDLHRARAVATVEHLGERRLQIDRLGRRALGRALVPADPRGDRAEQPGLQPSGLEQRADDEARRGLAVGPGDADDRQPVGRVAVEARGGRRHRRADGGDAHLGHAEAERALDDERGGAPGDGVEREVVAVAREARNAEEERSGLDPPVVVGQLRDLHRRGVRNPEDVAQQHGR
jgi:hypothetical protein